MARVVEAAEVPGHQPAVNDGFRRKFRLVQVARHHRLASNGNFANAVGSRIHNAHLHPGQRLANRVRAKRFQIVRCYAHAGLGQPVGIRHGNAQVIKELQDLRFGEGATNEDGL